MANKHLPRFFLYAVGWNLKVYEIVGLSERLLNVSHPCKCVLIALNVYISI